VVFRLNRTMRSLLSFLLAVSGLVSAYAQTKTVRDFGALGDGVADDTVAIQKAVDSKGGAVVFPHGIYRLTKSIRVALDQTGWVALRGDGAARVIMAGSGPAFHFVGTHAGTAAPSTVKEGVWEKERTPMVDRIEIVGAHAEADGIRAEGTMQLTITATTVRKARHGIHLTGRNRNVLISDSHLYENRGCGIFYDRVNLHQSNVVNCHISYNAGGGVVTRGGEIRNLHIGTCDIESNMAPDNPPTANILLDSAEGSTDEVAITGCTIQHNSKSPGSANIRVLGRGITSAKNNTATQEGHIAITGNVFSDVAVNIHLRDARGVTITGNSFWEGFEHDLLVENSSSVVVGPNDFDRNPRYVVNGNWGKDRNGLVFRDSEDCKLNGFLVKGVWGKDAAVTLDGCRRFTVSDCSIFDSDGVGLLLKNCSKTMVRGCVVRDDREPRKATHSLKVEGGADNWIHDNWLANGVHPEDETTRDNRR
jgi:hypothetical protein